MNLSSKPAQSLYTGINASASDGMRTWSHPDCAARKSVALTFVVPSHLDSRDFHNLAPEIPAAPVGRFTVMRQSARWAASGVSKPAGVLLSTLRGG